MFAYIYTYIQNVASLLYCRYIMRMFCIDESRIIYLLNMTVLCVTYFIVRILTLPIVLVLHSLKQEPANSDGWIGYWPMAMAYSVIQSFIDIPIQCKVGTTVFYLLQLYWFSTIISTCIRSFKCVLRYKTNKGKTL